MKRILKVSIIVLALYIFLELACALAIQSFRWLTILKVIGTHMAYVVMCLMFYRLFPKIRVSLLLPCMSLFFWGLIGYSYFVDNDEYRKMMTGDFIFIFSELESYIFKVLWVFPDEMLCKVSREHSLLLYLVILQNLLKFSIWETGFLLFNRLKQQKNQPLLLGLVL